MIKPVNNKTYRKLKKGIGEAVAKRTILRKKENGKLETWGDVASRVALGNSLLEPKIENQQKEYDELNYHLSKATTLMSGRHLQHGDASQPTRNGEPFTNCSVCATSFLLHYLLLNGSGVGRAYDDALMVVDWDNMPIIECVIDAVHKDYDYLTDTTYAQAVHKYNNSWSRFDQNGNLLFNPSANAKVFYYKVPDSREGWSKCVEIIETMAYRGIYANRRLVLDFSDVRPEGSPIGGMQGRPSSGPKPFMLALRKVQSIKGAGMPKWKQTMFVDHYLAECVLVGGARRSARIATKIWIDPGALEFVHIKDTGELWSANNSLSVTKDFWKLETPYAVKLYTEAIRASYRNGTGEPGFINVDKLTRNEKGREDFLTSFNIGSVRYGLGDNAKTLMKELFTNSSTILYPMTVNPCGEICIWIGGGYCTIADVVPYHADTIDEAEAAFRVTTRALIRTNLMDFVYKDEVKRTNRIGVGITGLHEFAWKFFNIGFRDMILMEEFDNPEKEKNYDPDLVTRIKGFWNSLNRFNNAVIDEARKYCKELGVVVPHTMLTAKPSGSVSKLFGLTEGVHLPAMREYLRWVQFKNNDPLVEVYKKKGYQTRELKQYNGMTIVAFPTIPEICNLGMGNRLLTAPEANFQEQYTYLRLLEKYYLNGKEPKSDKFRTSSRTKANQISYTMKYYKNSMTEQELHDLVLKNQPTVTCCSIMPSGNDSIYEYLPEQSVTKLEFENIISKIRDQDDEITEDIDATHLSCAGGACPIDVKTDAEMKEIIKESN